MNHINDPIVTPRKIAKASILGNKDGVARLAKFVCSSSLTDCWAIFEACQQQRVMGLVAKEKECDKLYDE